MHCQGLRTLSPAFPGNTVALSLSLVMQILCSVAEHHSNLVPWQLVAQRTGAKLRHVPIRQDTQEIDMDVSFTSTSRR